MGKIEDIKANFDRLYKKEKSFHQVEKGRGVIKINGDLFCCNSPDGKDHSIWGRLQDASEEFIDKAADILQAEVENVEGYLDSKGGGDASHIPGPRSDSEYDDDGSADFIPD